MYGDFPAKILCRMCTVYTYNIMVLAHPTYYTARCASPLVHFSADRAQVGSANTLENVRPFLSNTGTKT
jgi:hypothetical protein